MRKETLQRLIEEKEIELAGLKMLGENLDMTTCEEKPDGKQTEKPAAEKTGKKTTAKKETSESQEGEKKSYDDMKSAELYALCCERGISSQCKDRKKDTLVALLKENDKKGAAKEAVPEKKKDAKASKEADDWDDDDDWGEDQEEKDPYIGKDAKELYRMCVTRGLVVEKRKDAKVYADALKEDDKKEKASEAADDDEDDDAWEV